MCALNLKLKKVLSSALILVALGFMFTQCDKLDDYTPEKGPKGKDPVKDYPEDCEGQEVGFQTIQKVSMEILKKTKTWSLHKRLNGSQFGKI